MTVVYTTVEPSDVNRSAEPYLPGMLDDLAGAGAGVVPEKGMDIENVQSPFIPRTEGDGSMKPREQSGI